MKFAGMTGLLLSTTAIGWLLSDAARRRMLICRELLQFCDRLTAEINSRRTPVLQILECYPLRYIDITAENITENKAVISPLKEEDNRVISAFFGSLGKSDGKAQISLIDGFRDYLSKAEVAYREQCQKNARLYLSFGFFGGLLLSLLLI